MHLVMLSKLIPIGPLSNAGHCSALSKRQNQDLKGEKKLQFLLNSL